MARTTSLGWAILLTALAASQPAAGQIVPNFWGGTLAMTRDSTGAFFVGGFTSSFPVTPGAYQTQHTQKICVAGLGPQPGGYPCNTGFVAKYSSSGDIGWATYLGAPIDENDAVSSIAVDPDGNVWVQGDATSQSFPTTANAYLPSYPGGFSSAFLAELSPDGSRLLYSTFLDTQFSGTLKAAQRDALYFVGDGVIKFNPTTNQIIYRVLQGQLSGEIGSRTFSLADARGMFYLAASSDTADFPVTPGVYSHPSLGYDVVLLGLDPAGNLLFSTKIGGTGYDDVAGMSRDAAGNFHLVGYSYSADFPVTGYPNLGTPGPYGNAFVLKLSPDLGKLIYSYPSFSSGLIIPAGYLEEVKFDSEGRLSMLVANAVSNGIPLTANVYPPCYPILSAGTNWPSGAWAFVRLTADFQAVEYAAPVPFFGSSDYGPWPFDFDTSGTVYRTPGPNLGFTAIDLSDVPHPGPVCLAETAQQTATAVVPGLLLSVLGPGIGPDQPTPLMLDSAGRVATEIAGTQVLFDGIPAPILAAQSGRVDVVAPFGLSTQGVTIVSVLRNGNLLGRMSSVAGPGPAPWFYSVDGSGAGGIAWDQKGQPNSPTNPAHVGDYLTFYATGAGAMTPTPVDGTIPKSPQSTVSGPVFISSYCPVSYAGDVPGLVEGIVQINCRLIGPLPASPITVVGGGNHLIYVE